MLINEGILEKDFRSRFARIEALAKSEIKFQNPLSELFFKKLGTDYYFVRSVRMDANKSNPDNHDLKVMLDKIKSDIKSISLINPLSSISPIQRSHSALNFFKILA